MKKIFLSLVFIIVLTLTSGCVNKEKVLKKELDKRYDNYEIIESSRYWNTGGSNQVEGVVKINNNFYEIIVDMSGETTEYYESVAKEIYYNVEVNEKQYSSNDNLILLELPYGEDGIKEQSSLLLFMENESSSDFYDVLYQLLTKLNDEFKTKTNYPSIQVNFTNYIDYSKKEDYKLFLLLKRLSWNDNERTKKLYKELKVNNYFTFNRPYTESNDERLNYLKQSVQDLKESYEAGMLYEDYVYEKEMGNY